MTMDKEIFQKSFTEKLDKNFSELSKNFEFRFKIFSEFNTLIFELNKCLILELNRAAITLTNHLLERLLKLALIYDEAGFGPTPLEDWNEKFGTPTKKYNSINLGSSIELCRKKNLITKSEKDILFNKIRILMRNGFSHADSTDILANIPDETPMFVGNLKNPNEKLKEIGINQKIIPTFQAIQMEGFAKESAKPYFHFVFSLIHKIENRLLEKR
jgi:hypothetical protein